MTVDTTDCRCEHSGYMANPKICKKLHKSKKISSNLESERKTPENIYEVTRIEVTVDVVRSVR